MTVYPVQFPPSNTPIVDQSGNMSNSGMAFFRALYNRTGQESGVLYTTADNLTATGTTVANALPLMADLNNVVTVPTGSGVLLPAQGQTIWVFNNDPANALNIYPPTGASITYQGVNSGVNNPISVSFGSLAAMFYFSNTSIVAA